MPAQALSHAQNLSSLATMSAPSSVVLHDATNLGLNPSVSAHHQHHHHAHASRCGDNAGAPVSVSAGGNAKSGGGNNSNKRDRSNSRNQREKRAAAREAARAAARDHALQDHMAVDTEEADESHESGETTTSATTRQHEQSRGGESAGSADATDSSSQSQESGEAGDHSPHAHSADDSGDAAGAPTPCVMVPAADSESILADVTTLILFDWDDTLLASSHLASSGYRLDDPDQLPDHVQEQLSLLEDAVIPVLNLARSLGTLCIITNAETGWVELSCKKFMPRVVQHLEGLHVLSARSTFESRFPGLPAKWKLEAFTQRICALPHEEPKNVISLGDSTAERDAVRTVTRRMTDIFTKSVKFVERPTIEQLWRELQLLRGVFKMICEMPDDMDLALTVKAMPANGEKVQKSHSSSPMHDMRSSHPSVAARQSIQAHVPCPVPIPI